MECSCCGLERDPVTALQCDVEVKLCRPCIEWLRQRSGTIDSTPTLPVVDMNIAVEFYERAGFDVERYDDGFAFVEGDGSSVFNLDLAEHIDPARNGAGCYLVVPDPDAWHQRLTAADLPVTAIEKMPWGMREFTLTDPSGNHLRIGAPA